MESNSTAQLNDVHNANATHAALTDVQDRWWLPLAIAIPVCLVGIVLVTVLVLIVITCHRSKVKHKQKNSESNGKFNEAAGNHNESTDTGIFSPPYANMSETIREAKLRPLVLAHSNGSKGGNEIARAAWSRTQSTPNEHPKNTSFSMENDVKEKEKKKKGEGKRGSRDPVAELDDGKSATKEDKAAGVTLNTATPGGGESIDGHDQVVMRVRSQQQIDDIGDEQVDAPGKPAGQTDNRKTFVVMYSVESKDAGRLPLSVNDVIFYLDEEKDGWMKGEKKESGEVGWFPRSHVREGMSPLAKRPSLPKMEGLELKEAKRPIDFTKPTTTATASTTTTTGVISKADDQYNDTDEDFDDDDDDDDEDDDYETGIEYEAMYSYRALEYGDLNFDAGDVIVVVEKHENGWWRGYRGDEQGFFPGSYVQLKSFEEKTQISKDAHLKDGELSSPTDDVSRSVTQLLPISVINEEAEDDDDGGGDDTKKKKRKKKKKRRSSLGLFLLSLPRKMSVAKTGSLGHDSPDTPTTEKIKKTDKTVKKKKNKTKNSKGANQSPFVRRSSLAPGPPSGDQQTGVARKNVAQTVAKTPEPKNKRDTEYEDIGTDRLLIGWRLDSTANGVTEPSLVDSINSELKTRGNSDKLSKNTSIIDDAASQVTKLDVPTARNKSTGAGTVAVRPVSTVVAAGGVPSKPVPPRKPNFSGSTPNMASALLDSDEYKSVQAKRQSADKKPKLMAKPRLIVSEKLHGEPNGGVGHPSEPRSEPPSAAKPGYLRPGFPTGPAGGSSGLGTAVPPVPRELCRSLDSVLPGTETEEEEEEEEEFEIVKWLQRKLSEEDAQDPKRRDETTAFGNSTISTNAEEFRRKSPNAKPEFFGETNDRISFMIEDMFKCGLHEESYA